MKPTEWKPASGEKVTWADYLIWLSGKRLSDFKDGSFDHSNLKRIDHVIMMAAINCKPTNDTRSHH